MHFYVISALGKLRQEDCRFEASLGYKARLSLKKKKKTLKKKKFKKVFSPWCNR
jgi:hypothetical protein